MLLTAFSVVIADVEKTKISDQTIEFFYDDKNKEQIEKFYNSLKQEELIQEWVREMTTNFGEVENPSITLLTALSLENGMLIAKTIDTSKDPKLEAAFKNDKEYVTKLANKRRETDSMIYCSLNNHRYFILKRNLILQIAYIHYKTKKELIHYTLDKQKCETILKKIEPWNN